MSEHDDEVERLRARVAELEQQGPAGQGPEVPGGAAGTDHHVRGWSVVSGILVVLACVLAPLSVVSVWADREISDTDQYVQTVAPLAEDPGLQAIVADRVTTAVFDNLDLDKLTQRTLTALAAQRDVPPGVQAALPALKQPLVNGIESYTRDQVQTVLGTPEFAQVWASVNRIAHEQVLKLLEGNQGGAVSAQGDAVTLNLGPVVAQVRARLVDQGFALAKNIPTVDQSFVLVQSGSVTKAQWAYRTLDTLGTWLPVIALALLVVGVLLAADRRRALVRGSLGVVASMLLLGLVLALARAWYVDHTPADVLTPTVAGTVFDTLVRFLRTSLRAVGVLGLVVALAAYLSGPSPLAVRTRATFRHGIGSLRAGAETAGWQSGRVGTWTYTHRRALRIGAAMLGGLVLAFWSRPTAWVVVVVALLVLLVLALVEFVGRPAGPPPAT